MGMCFRVSPFTHFTADLHTAAEGSEKEERIEALWSRKINRTTRTRFQPWQLISSLPNDLFPHMSSCDYASPAVIFQCNAVTAACYFKSLSTRKKSTSSFLLRALHLTAGFAIRRQEAICHFETFQMLQTLNVRDAISMKVTYFKKNLCKRFF